MKKLLCVVALGAVTAAAWADGNVGFTDEQFEKVAYKILLNHVEPNTRCNPQIYGKSTDYYEAKFRLMPGRILLHDIKGEPSAYIYMGYFGEGKTPTVEDVVAKSISRHDEFWSYLSNMTYDPQGYKRFFESTFPEYIYTSSIILGVNAADAAYFESRSDIPHIIQNQKGAEDLAKGYFNSEDITLVRYIWGLSSKINGYEFSNGQNRIIVPFDIHTRRLFIDSIYTREEIDRDIDSYILDVDPREGESYQKLMDVELASAENSRVDSDEDVFLPGGKAAAALGAGEIDYEYPPEYGELFERFRAITPEEAQMWVSAQGDPPGGEGAASQILEPVIFMCLDGIPGYYLIIGYEGRDADIRETAEDLISLLNEEEGFDPAELKAKFEIIHEHKLEFSTSIVRAWPWHRRIAGECPEFSIWIVTDLHLFANKAGAEFGADFLHKIRFYATAIDISEPLLAFENGNGDVKYLSGTQDPVTLEEVEATIAASLERRYNDFLNRKEAYEETREAWARTLTDIKRDSKKERGYYVMFDKPEDRR
jgi:hypothetical protein